MHDTTKSKIPPKRGRRGGGRVCYHLACLLPHGLRHDRLRHLAERGQHDPAAAAGAARASIAGLNTTEREAFARNYIESALNANAFVDPEKVLVEVGDNPDMEGSYRVVITYDAAELPIWNLIGSDLLPGPEIRRESVILNGGV